LKLSGFQVVENMERETGIEPATNSLEGCDSTTELLPLASVFNTPPLLENTIPLQTESESRSAPNLPTALFLLSKSTTALRVSEATWPDVHAGADPHQRPTCFGAPPRLCLGSLPKASSAAKHAVF
jgi:hypothetical protein